jgi:hypothetical protein
MLVIADHSAGRGPLSWLLSTNLQARKRGAPAARSRTSAAAARAYACHLRPHTTAQAQRCRTSMRPQGHGCTARTQVQQPAATAAYSAQPAAAVLAHQPASAAAPTTPCNPQHARMQPPCKHTARAAQQASHAAWLPGGASAQQPCRAARNAATGAQPACHAQTPQACHGGPLGRQRPAQLVVGQVPARAPARCASRTQPHISSSSSGCLRLPPEAAHHRASTALPHQHATTGAALHSTPAVILAYSAQPAAAVLAHQPATAAAPTTPCKHTACAHACTLQEHSTRSATSQPCF